VAGGARRRMRKSHFPQCKTVEGKSDPDLIIDEEKKRRLTDVSWGLQHRLETVVSVLLEPRLLLESRR